MTTTKNKPPKKRLGRGLDGLLPAASPRPAAARGPARKANIEELHPNPNQPRRHFDEEALQELAASIGEHGLLEPILVRSRARGGFEIIAGERRWRASQKAGLHEVPIFVRDLSDEVAFEAALVENLQREDLNPLETAQAFQRLVDDFGHTQDAIAKRVGKDRSSVSNALRLLKLPEVVQQHLVSGELSEGHGRALLVAGDDNAIKKLAKEAIAKKWSVRETERQARAFVKAGGATKPAAPKSKSANVLDLERRLTHSVGAPVTLEDKKGGKGNLVIKYASYDELDQILAKLGVQ